MVGRPNFPEDVDSRDDLKGSATGTPGLTALDQEREASLADEGGAAGAAVETQDEEGRKKLAETLPHLVVCDENSCEHDHHHDDDEGEAAASLVLVLGGALVVVALALLLRKL
jgi:hypothetical protein